VTQAQLVTAATGAALLAHKRYEIDRTKRVDVFNVLREAAGEVFFRPLKKICGAYLPLRDCAPGVLINSNLPLSRQRYTAAHEFGHLFLKHSAVSVDEMTGVSFEERRNWSDEENIAETFAAFFLMPQALVDRSLRELNIATLSPETVYLLSLKIGTSYRATVNHLQTLRKLSASQAAHFRNIRPKQIKSGISEHVAARHDVWVLDEHWNGQQVFPAVQDTIVIRLPEIPTSGYTWMWHPNPDMLSMVEDKFADEDPLAVGGERVRELTLEVASGEHPEKIDLVRRQPWDADGEPSAQFTLDLVPQETRKSGPLVLPTLQWN
jgi:Zn-dependent peptidase ImmA (M78 family)/predicted secreted protein